ncbi:hypothetical protein GQX74_008637 [Glossina fuscipes]|nr:hypothetical protein GQX74_008637 [Glossina fuscipes]
MIPIVAINCKLGRFAYCKRSCLAEEIDYDNANIDDDSGGDSGCVDGGGVGAGGSGSGSGGDSSGGGCGGRGGGSGGGSRSGCGNIVLIVRLCVCNLWLIVRRDLNNKSDLLVLERGSRGPSTVTLIALA